MNLGSHFGNIELLRLTSLEGPLLDLGSQLPPERNAGQHKGAEAHHDDDRKFGHGNLLQSDSVSDGMIGGISTLGRDGALGDDGLYAPSGFNSVTQIPCLGTLAADSVIPRAGSAAFLLSASAGSGTGDAATSAGTVPPMAPAAVSNFDPGPCGIDFDDEREFDFSRVKARLRLVISNSSPVKA